MKIFVFSCLLWFLSVPTVSRGQATTPTHSVEKLSPADIVARRSLNTSKVDGVDFGYRPLVGQSLIEDENFYLLTIFEQTPAALHALMSNPDIDSIGRSVASRAKVAAAACQAEFTSRSGDGQVDVETACTPEALRWTDTERLTSAEAMGRIYDESAAVRRIVQEHMRPSGRFQRDAGLDDRALLIKAWEDAQEAIDRIIRVYALGERPRYADIDSIIYPKDGTYYREILSLAIWETGRQADTPAPSYNISLKFALELMEINRRDDAVRQLKLQETENVPTFSYLRGVKWADYKYSAIVVPGWSPEISYEPLNPGRKISLRHAAELYRDHLAPVIIVSGARLRPIGTVWTEGLEMKHYLVGELGIPSDHILIQTVSRHTHTEMRDNGRMIFRTGAPLQKKALVINEVHSIPSKAQMARCERDLGYVPYTRYGWLDSITFEVIPNLKSLHRKRRIQWILRTTQ